MLFSIQTAAVQLLTGGHKTPPHVNTTPTLVFEKEKKSPRVCWGFVFNVKRILVITFTAVMMEAPCLPFFNASEGKWQYFRGYFLFVLAFPRFSITQTNVGGPPTELVVLQRQRDVTSLAHDSRHGDLSGGEVAVCPLVLLFLLDVQRCVSAWRWDQLVSGEHRFIFHFRYWSGANLALKVPYYA